MTHPPSNHDTPGVSDASSARTLFEAQVDGLDAPTATALRARRREALASLGTAHRRAWWWPASGIVTAALAVAVWLPRSEVGGPSHDTDHRVPEATASAPADAPSLIDTDTAPREDAARFADGAFAELENDPEFYAWLATLPADDDTPRLPTQAEPEGLPL